jgi:limonene-1,2-epoxide hydrolase
VSNPYDEARAGSLAAAKAAIDSTQEFFDAVEHMDFAAVAAMMAPEGLYRDEPSHEADAVGPAAVEAKLRGALGGLDSFVIGMDRVSASPGMTLSRRVEEWHFPTGEVVTLPVMCVQEWNVEGKLTLWHEFWNMPTLIEQMPQSWMQELAKRSGTDP